MKFKDVLTSIGDAIQSSLSSGSNDDRDRVSEVDDLRTEFLAARRAIDAGHAQEAVNRLETTLDDLSVVMAACWALVGYAYEQLRQVKRSENAYRRAAKEYKGTRALPDADQTLAITSALAALGRHKEIVELLTKVAEAYPDRADILALLADELALSGDRLGAARVHARRGSLLAPTDRASELQKAVDLDPDEQSYRELLGAALLDAGDTRAARQTLEPLVAQNPERAGVLALLAEALRREGDLTGARERADLVLAQDDRNVDALLVRAKVLGVAGRADEALTDVERILQLEPDHLDAHATRFDIVLREGRDDGLIDDVRVVASMDPVRATSLAQSLSEVAPALATQAFDFLVTLPDPPARAWLGRGRLHYVNDDGRNAEADLNRAIAVATAQQCTDVLAEALAWQGENRRLLGDVDGALDSLNRSLDIEPTAFALLCRGRVHASLGARERAIDDFVQSSQLAPDRAWVQLELAEQYRLGDQFDLALGALDAAERNGDDSPYLHGTRGQILRAQGHVDAAIDELWRAFEAQKRAWIANELADSLLDAGRVVADYERALEVIDQGQQASPNEPILLRTKAEALRLIGRSAEGLATIDDYLAQDPTDRTALASRAHLLTDLGLASDALGVVDGEWSDLSSLFAQSAKVRALRFLEQQTAALELVEQLGNLYPEDEWLPQMRVSLQADLFDFASAIDGAEALLAADPNNRWMHGAAGFCHRRMEPPDLVRALTHLRHADDGDPPDPGIKVELAEALLMARAPGPRDFYEEVLRTADAERRDPSTMSLIAWACLRLGRTEEAVAGFETAVRSDPSRINDRFNLGLALIAAGRRTLALDEYEDGAELVCRHSDARRASALASEAIADLAAALAGLGTPEIGPDLDGDATRDAEQAHDLLLRTRSRIARAGDASTDV